MTTSDIRAWLAQAHARLSPRRDNPALEAQVLLTAALQRPRTWVFAHPEATLTSEQTRALDLKLERLLAGEPLPYLIGHWEFFGLDLLVAPAVLIPRPETELLVEQALQWLHANPARRTVADVGCGSGCIAISLASRISDLKLTAIDCSLDALVIAQKNSARHNLQSRVHLAASNLLTAFESRWDLVCANLPYIPTATWANLEVAEYEPRLALDGGADGLVFIQRLLEDAPRWLAPQALILIEIDPEQKSAAMRIARRVFPAAQAEVIPDLAGAPRLLRVQT